MNIRSIMAVIAIASFLTACGGGDGDTAPPANQDAPTLAAIGTQSVTSGDTVSFTVNASDPNSLDLTYATNGNVGSGDNPYIDTGSLAIFDTPPANSREFRWDTTGVPTGNYDVEFSVMNSAALSDSETVRITISSTPPPVTTGQTLYTNNCVSGGCHNSTASGSSGPFGDPSGADIESAIDNGNGGMNRASLQALTIDELNLIAAYIATL